MKNSKKGTENKIRMLKQKKCKCGCNRYPTIGFAGYNYSCAPSEIKEAVLKKRKAARNKMINKSIEHRKQKLNEYFNSGMDKWFEERRKELKGKCINCGSPINVHNDLWYKFFIAHVVPKGIIGSVKMHPNNFIELCMKCHTDFDRDFYTASQMKCFPAAKAKFKTFSHLIPKEEMRQVSPYLTK